MERLNKRIDRFMEMIFGLIGTGMILVASYNVIARNILRISTPWSDELLKLLNVWVIFVLAAMVFLDDTLIALTLVEDSSRVQSNPRVYNGLKIFQYVLAGVINAELVRELAAIVSTQMNTGEITTVLRYPLYFLNIGMCVGSILTVLFSAVKIIGRIQNIRTAVRKEERRI